MKKILLTLIVAVSVLTAGTAAAEPTQGTDLAALAREADRVVINCYSPTGQTNVQFSDPLWQERLADALLQGAYEPQPHCLCISYPQITLMREGRQIGRLSVHHGEKLRAYGRSASGDYQVGAEVGKAINDLAIEKQAPPPAKTAPHPD